MSEKIQGITSEELDANALALSFLRLGKFEEAVTYFTEAYLFRWYSGRT